MKRLLLILTVLTVFFGFAVAAYAVEIEVPEPLNITATVVETCTVLTQDINFGDYGGIEVIAHGAIDITCIEGLNYEVALDIGMNDDGVGRRMTDGIGNYLPYAIYKTDALSSGWGDECVGTPTFPSQTCSGPFVSDGSLNSLEPWGQIPASQVAPTGDYADVVSITIVY